MRFIISLFFALIAAPAFADCVSDCQASTYCGGSSWECAQNQNICFRSCNNSSSEAVSGEYGALAVGPESLAYGMSDRSPTEEKARKSAMRFCRKNGKDCEVVETYHNTCVAIAESSDGTLGWDDDDDKKDAIAGAIKACNKKTDKEDCKLARANCYSE